MLLSASLAPAQSASTLMGARATSLGYASSCISDEWSILNNVAGLAEIEFFSLASSYNAHPDFKPFDRMAAAMSTPLKSGAFGIGVFKFGDVLYNEHVLSAAYSNKFGLASLGLKVNYIQYKAEGFGRAGIITVSFGGIARLTPHLTFGAHITNINHPRLASATRETVPTIVTAGLAFLPSDKILVTAEVEKDLIHDAVVKSGVEYQMRKKFFIRTGFNIDPPAAFFGLGFSLRKISVDYALHCDFNIGLNHQASLCYKIPKK